MNNSIEKQWKRKYSKLSIKDMKKLDKQIQARVITNLRKVSINPLPKTEGGYGNPLHKPLQNCYKIKLKADCIRITYKLDRIKKEIHIIVVGLRNDDAVYLETERRLALDLEYNL